MASYDILFAKRTEILQVFPELRNLLTTPRRGGCMSCRKKSIARAIVIKMRDLARDGRKTGNLQNLMGL
jgi:hypothetical protein